MSASLLLRDAVLHPRVGPEEKTAENGRNRYGRR
jgi:hypothetical protein